MQQYLDLLRLVKTQGKFKGDRTGTGTYSVFGAQTRFNLQEGFPLLTTKKLHFKSIVHELLWFLSGDTNVKYLQDNGVTIWNDWSTQEQCAKFGREAGDLGPIYGHQWRNFGGSYIPAGSKIDFFGPKGFDQITWVQDEIRKNPNSRRLIVTGWNPEEQNLVALPPCHTLFQFFVQDGFLSCQLYQRSCDIFLGVPYNIASYALLTHMMAHCTGLKVGDFVHTFGDLHIYTNHMEQVDLQLTREPMSLPKLHLNLAKRSVMNFNYDDILLTDYNAHPSIKAPVAV